MSFNFSKTKESIADTISALQKNLSGLRSGRVSTALLEPILVEAYGSKVPLNQIGNVNVAQARTLSIQVWDTSLTKATEKAIRDSGMGFNPSIDGNVVYVTVPDLTMERRKEMVKKAKDYSEKAKISIRNTRQETLKLIIAEEKAGICSEDQMFANQKELQKFIDEAIKKVDDIMAVREKEIMEV